MTTINSARRVRWLAPAAVATILIGGALALNSVTATASTELPPRSAAQLLSDVRQATLGAVSGTVVQTADLGIPDLPGLGGTRSSELTSLVAGTHTLRVWYDGTDKARIALLGTLGESDVIKNGADIWTWSSHDNTATHRTLVGGEAAQPGAVPGGLDPTHLPASPQAATDAVLAAIDPSTVVTTDNSQTVAGRSVYELTLSPRDPAGSLISRVTVAVDADQHIPLRVQVFAVGHADPSFEVAFTAVDFSAPDPAQFTFNPPAGAEVTEIPAGKLLAGPGLETDAAAAAGHVAPKLVGSGWTTVAVVSTGGVGTSNSQLHLLLQALPAVSGAWGSGHLFTGTLFSAVVTDDGRIAVGAVQPELLYAALSG